MADPLDDKLVIGISTRALFDLDEANNVFEEHGLEAYREFERAHERDVLMAGTGFRLVKGLLDIRAPETGNPLVEVILLSRNDPDSSMRVFNSIESHDLAITRGAFRGGRDPWPFLPAFNCELFLSAEPMAVREALSEGTPAALVLQPPGVDSDPAAGPEVLIAFDGDAVLFDEESDRIFQDEGPEAFFKHESDNAEVALSPGPFRPFLTSLARLQAHFPDGASPIRTALVTARNAPAHRRVVNTFRSWGVRVDEAYFLGGIGKAAILKSLRPHIFFDDQLKNLEDAASAVPSAHVLQRSSAIEQVPMFGETLEAAPRRRSSSGRGASTSAKAMPETKKGRRVGPLPRQTQPVPLTDESSDRVSSGAPSVAEDVPAS